MYTALLPLQTLVWGGGSVAAGRAANEGRLWPTLLHGPQTRYGRDVELWSQLRWHWSIAPISPPERSSQTVDTMCVRTTSNRESCAEHATGALVPDWEYPCSSEPRGNRGSCAGHTSGASGGNCERCAVHTTGARGACWADCGCLCASTPRWNRGSRAGHTTRCSSICCQLRSASDRIRFGTCRRFQSASDRIRFGTCRHLYTACCHSHGTCSAGRKRDTCTLGRVHSTVASERIWCSSTCCHLHGACSLTWLQHLLPRTRLVSSTPLQ